MGDKASRDKLSARGKIDVYMFDPEDVHLVTKEGDVLYDERVKSPYDEGLVLNIMYAPDGETPQGVLEPTIGRRNTETGKIDIVDGRHRTLACREANKRLKKQGAKPLLLPVWIRRSNDSRAFAALVSANHHRKEDTPLNRAKKAQRYIDMGHSEKEISFLLGVSEATVKNLLRLLDAPAVVRQAVESGKINAADGYKLAREEPETARKKVAELMEHAPRVPGKKRSRNAQKAREIMGDGKPKAPPKGAEVEVHEPQLQVAGEVSRKQRKKIEDDTVESIAHWIETHWDAPPEIAAMLRSGEWRTEANSKGKAANEPQAAAAGSA